VWIIQQAVGGAMASIAANQLNDAQPGTNVMMTGVIFQLVAMTIFAGLAIDFTRHAVAMNVPPQFNRVTVVLFVSFTAIYARRIFRVVELGEGWTGYLMLNERLFIALDGSLMVLAVSVFLLFDPAAVFPKGINSSFRALWNRNFDRDQFISFHLLEAAKNGSECGLYYD
jgi:hypothetical protein